VAGHSLMRRLRRESRLSGCTELEKSDGVCLPAWERCGAQGRRGGVFIRVRNSDAKDRAAGCNTRITPTQSQSRRPRRPRSATAHRWREPGPENTKVGLDDAARRAGPQLDLARRHGQRGGDQGSCESPCRRLKRPLQDSTTLHRGVVAPRWAPRHGRRRSTERTRPALVVTFGPIRTARRAAI
jgi:hypothetical protein